MNNGAGNRWTEMEKFFNLVPGNPEIYYTIQIGLVDYIKAFNIEAGSTRLLP
jgi:hypothetical protein